MRMIIVLILALAYITARKLVWVTKRYRAVESLRKTFNYRHSVKTMAITALGIKSEIIPGELKNFVEKASQILA